MVRCTTAEFLHIVFLMASTNGGLIVKILVYAPRARIIARMMPGLLIVGLASIATAHAADPGWPSYNRTLKSDRFSPLSQITRDTVSKLKVACIYDTDVETGFQTGPIVVGETLYATTKFDMIAIDPATCE